ncbi:septum site-determining protein MinC [Ramlibacter sp. 2FC]|uniref:septum site-determining protein MinC n=1 Tax=Ramlibacter sp. 2FC TaxID=2502188 RepID=UPI0010F47423|nr:septum site-determining protein MinC [Ramlibacter sp. 2FC]
MPVALAGSAPATFEIKSANLPLVALLLKSAELADVARDLAQRFGDIPDFFDQDPLLVDLTPLQDSDPEAELDFPALLELLRGYRLLPLAVRGGSPAQLAAAQAAGLVPAADALVQKTQAAAPAPAPAAAPAAAQPQGALVIDRPLRSGQQVYARGRDLIVRAIVNPGAEVIADGHIHVYAPLRGKAIAGARGDGQARIFALSMEPELISIAGIYRTSENALPPEIWGQPTQVRLVAGPDGDKLVMEPLKA